MMVSRKVFWGATCPRRTGILMGWSGCGASPELKLSLTHLYTVSGEGHADSARTTSSASRGTGKRAARSSEPPAASTLPYPYSLHLCLLVCECVCVCCRKEEEEEEKLLSYLRFRMKWCKRAYFVPLRVGGTTLTMSPQTKLTLAQSQVGIFFFPSLSAFFS